MYATPIKRMLAARGVTVQWFCKHVLGIKPQRFDHYEAGRAKWPPEILEKAARYFAIPYQDFIRIVGHEAIRPERRAKADEAA